MSDQNKKVGAGFGVMIMKDRKVLLGKRHIDPEKADSLLNGAATWTMPGGKMEFGETFEDAAKRETKEETDIDLEDVQVMCVNNERIDSAHFVTIGLYSEKFKGDPGVMEPDEITEWRWFELDDLPSPVYFPSKEIIENYKQGKFYISENNFINKHI
ncbi:MAG: NUDIX domain-containing protein [Parcubacteria group bacterium]|jgi:ADP-ribose pyrophosphatase YjhB (NUDIX family)